ncbi:hypothetical protein [Myxococcus stipitatus]
MAIEHTHDTRKLATGKGAELRTSKVRQALLTEGATPHVTDE